MKNFVQNGDMLHTVLADTVKGGDLVILQDTVGIAVTDGDGVNLNAVQTVGVFTLPKATGAIAQGKKAYWNATESNVTATATGNTLIGVAWDSAASADTTVNVKLG